MAVALVLAAFGGVLDNSFHEIDDGLHLAGVLDGVDPSPHLRPLHFLWNRLLFWFFGARSAGWYAAGMLLHVVGAAALGALVRRVTERRLPALVATAVFAVLYAPHEVVLWISASCGLLVVFFLVLATLAWDVFLVGGRRRFYWLALLCALGALASKEDGVLLAPLFLGLDRLRNGPQWKRGFLRRYALFAALGTLYLALAFRPGLWADSVDVGRYELRAELVPKLVQNLALLSWPRAIDPRVAPGWAFSAGLLLLAGFTSAAWFVRRRSPLVGYGLLVTLCGLLPVLPGADAVFAVQRYAYPSALGLALLAGGLAQLLADAFPRASRARPALAAGATLLFLGWIAVQVAAIRSVERWRFSEKCARFQRAIDTTRERVLLPLSTPGGLERAIVLAPALWNPQDYLGGLRAVAGVPREQLQLDYVPIADFERRLGSGAWSGPGVFVGESDASIALLAEAGDRTGSLPWPRWEVQAAELERRGLGRVLPVVEIRRRAR